MIADQIIGPRGQIGATYTGPLILGIYARGHYGQIFDSPLVLVPFTLMFLLPLLLLRGRSWFDRFDIAALLTFGVSYLLFDNSHLEPARVDVLSAADLPARPDADPRATGRARSRAGSTAACRRPCSCSAWSR